MAVRIIHDVAIILSALAEAFPLLERVKRWEEWGISAQVMVPVGHHVPRGLLVRALTIVPLDLVKGVIVGGLALVFPVPKGLSAWSNLEKAVAPLLAPA